MADSLVIAAYDPQWAGMFAQLGAALRLALGAPALRIDRIGPTVIAGPAGYTAAKAPFIWAVMARADRWSQAIGWEAGPTDQ